MKSIRGIPASSGLAMGTARYLRHAQSGLGRAVRSPKEEQAAFEEAVRQAQNQLAKLGGPAGTQDREIFMVQRLLLEDPALLEEIASYISVGASAAAAMERAAGIFSRNIRALEDPYMRERACDILDACLRVVKILDDQPHETLHLTGPAILVADELYPTDIAMLDRSLVTGFVTTAGSPDAHAAIIARTLGIPAVVMAGEPEALRECDGRLLALNGDTGEAFLDPDDATRARFAHELRQMRRHMVSPQHLHTTPCTTQDGTPIKLLAACTSPEEVRDAACMGADGISLQLSGARLRDEEAQYRFYSACIEAADGRPVCVRIFDVPDDMPGDIPDSASDHTPGSTPKNMPDNTSGGVSDSTLSGVPAEASSQTPSGAPSEVPSAVQKSRSLGLRGVRYCLEHPESFETQLRALLRAGLLGNLRILLPMVSAREEQERAWEAMERAKTALRGRDVPFEETVPVGISIETPAAALQAGELARRAAFFHVDTDLLSEYAFAADRADPQMRQYLPDASPAIYRLLHFALEAAHEARIPLCLCGGGASRPALAETYARMGVRAFSLPTREMMAVKTYLMGVML